MIAWKLIWNCDRHEMQLKINTEKLLRIFNAMSWKHQFAFSMKFNEFHTGECYQLNKEWHKVIVWHSLSIPSDFSFASWIAKPSEQAQQMRFSSLKLLSNFKCSIIFRSLNKTILKFGYSWVEREEHWIVLLDLSSTLRWFICKHLNRVCKFKILIDKWMD